MCDEEKKVVENGDGDAGKCQCGCKTGSLTSFHRMGGLLLAALVGMGVGIGITWYACSYYPQNPTCSTIRDEPAESPNAKAPGPKAGRGGKARRSRARMANFQMRGIIKAVEEFHARTGAYPQGKLLPVTDPWGKLYIFACPGKDGRAFDVVSLGADAAPGGEGENADINSWELKVPPRRER